ncbi:MAG TPA: hypothetical protein VN181_14365 [Thermoanaerobaculia bacterium]|nr:hypothetical protein [Thermoanaerobaculia bacterium]
MNLPSVFEGESATLHAPVGAAEIPAVAETSRTMRGKLEELKVMTTGSMHTNPAKWTGIAAGAGLGLGLLGRFLQRRNRNKRLPRLLVVEA